MDLGGHGQPRYCSYQTVRGLEMRWEKKTPPDESRRSVVELQCQSLCAKKRRGGGLNQPGSWSWRLEMYEKKTQCVNRVQCYRLLVV